MKLVILNNENDQQVYIDCAKVLNDIINAIEKGKTKLKPDNFPYRLNPYRNRSPA